MRRITLICFLFTFWLVEAAHAASGLNISAVAGGEKPLGDFAPSTESTLNLRGSRGEILNFLLKVEPGSGCEVLAASSFRGQDGARVEIPFRFYQMHTIETEHPSFPGAQVGEMYDPLIPLQGRKTCAEKERAVWIWGEAELLRGAGAGSYTGVVRAGETTLPVNLRIWRMEIPEQPALPYYTEFSTWYNLLGHYGKWEPQEAELAELYAEQIRSHRITDISTNIKYPKVITRGGKPALDIRGYPTPEQSFLRVNLNGRPRWSRFGIPAVPHGDFELPATRTYYEAAENTLPEIRRPAKAMVYLWDEPQPQDLPRVKSYAKLVKEAAPSLKVMVTIPYQEELKDVVDIFCVVMDLFEAESHAEPETYRKIQRDGKEVWWYVSCMSHGCEALADSGMPDFVIDRPSVYIRSIPWLAHKYSIDGFLYYFVNYAYRFYPQRDPWNSVWDFSGNGDGTLFYPGRPGMHGLTSHLPVPSLRLKLWRESSYDAEYLKWISELKNPPEWFQEEYAELVYDTRSWSKSYKEYQTLRDRIGEYLDGLSPPAKRG